jgi:2-methylisocitrate lyase-like PEP mutase family enzyme
MTDDRSVALRRLLGGPEPVLAVGAADAWTARLIEDAGLPVVYVTGAGVANSTLGKPDIGLVTATELLWQVSRIRDAVDVPIIVDADTGFGGIGNVQRTVRDLERAGVSAIHIEDQVEPKRCGHLAGTTVVPIEEMTLRVRAAIAARTNPAFTIIARTDARVSEGLDSALRRAEACLAAGADGVFVEALVSEEEFATVGREFGDTILLANMVEGGKSPILPRADLQEMGFSIVLYANLALRLAGQAVRSGLQTLIETGSSTSMFEAILPWAERQDLVRLGDFAAAEDAVIASNSQ